MRVVVVLVPFDSGHVNERMGCGPGVLVGPIRSRLLDDGADVQTVEVVPSGRFVTEIESAFDVQRQVAAVVGEARSAGASVLILSGNCNTAAVGALGGLGTERPGLVWLDGHADFCTPETAETGYFDGMGLAMATGRCWRPMTATVPGFAPIADDRVLLIGAHDVESVEGQQLERCGISRVTVADLRTATPRAVLGPRLASLAHVVDATYVHVDLDVHDATFVPANHLAPVGGFTPAEVCDVVDLIRAALPVRVASLTAYDPAFDPHGVLANAATELAAHLVGSGAASTARLH